MNPFLQRNGGRYTAKNHVMMLETVVVRWEWANLVGSLRMYK